MQVEIKEYVKECLGKGVKPRLYRKFTIIHARQGKPGEVVETIMKDGHKETTGVVKIDDHNNLDWVVTNPDGERYIMPYEKFRSKYQIYDFNKGTYIPKKVICEFIQIDDDISFVAPWGEQMHIKKGGYLNITNINDIYGVQKQEFETTYKECDEYGDFLEEENLF